MKKRALSLFMALALCLTLLPTAALASDTSGHWAEKTIAEWQQKGYVSGYRDGTFRPDSSITRAEFSKLLNHVLGLTAEAAVPFTDVKETDWCYSEVTKAVAAGYAQGGTDGTFRPNAPITRTEAAVMLTRALSLAGNESRAAQFADASALPAWAKGSVGAVAEAGYMTGYPNGAFGAKDNITRAQAVVTLDRVQDVTITADGTVLTDKTVAGDLVIAESVGEGEVKLKNVTVEGDLIIRGGGANSVYLDGVTVQGEVRLEKENLHLRLQGGTKLGTVVVLAKVRLSGSGTIERLTAAVSGVTVDSSLTIRKTETTGGASAPTVSSSSSSGGGSSGSGSSASKEITGIAPSEPIAAAVDYGTAEADALAQLPQKIALKLTDGKGVEAAVTWTVSDYDATPANTTNYTAAGGITIPDGYTYNGSAALTAAATITVWGSSVTVQEIKAPDGIEVNNGTSETDAKKRLPSGVSLKTANGSTVFAEVTWNPKDGESYDPNAPGTVTYVGTVTIPDGYRFSGSKTVETTITVVAQGEIATDKKIDTSTWNVPDTRVERYTTDTNKIKAVLPDKIRLKCEDGSYITAQLDKTKWSDPVKEGPASATYQEYTSEIALNDVTLPDGYAWPDGTQPGTYTIPATIYVKVRDNTALQKALDAGYKQLNRITDDEREALADTNKIFKAAGGKSAADIATGVKFVRASDIDTQEKALKQLIEKIKDADSYDPNASQDTVDQLVTEINTAAANLEKALENPQTGTGYTAANILVNMKAWLDDPYLNSNFACSDDNQPLTQEEQNTNGYLLPSEAIGIQMSANENDTGNIGLEWSMSQTEYAELYHDKNGSGNRYIQVTETPDKPQPITLTATAKDYGEVGTYTCIIGAPIKQKTAPAVTVPELTSGKDNEEFKVSASTNSPEALDGNAITSHDNITATASNTSLLVNPKVIRVEDATVSGVAFTLTAETQALPVVVAPNNSSDPQYKTATVTITIPKENITLLANIKAKGWYIPTVGLKLTADVKVYPPSLTVTGADFDSFDRKVTVHFDTSHWNTYRSVWVALVPSSVANFTGNASGSFVLDPARTVGSNGNYSTPISVSGIQAGTYHVWIQVGDDGWVKSSYTYTHPAAAT